MSGVFACCVLSLACHACVFSVFVCFFSCFFCLFTVLSTRFPPPKHTQDGNTPPQSTLPPIMHASDLAAATTTSHNNNNDNYNNNDEYKNNNNDDHDQEAGPSTSGRGPSTPSRSRMSWRGWRGGSAASGRYARFVDEDDTHTRGQGGAHALQGQPGVEEGEHSKEGLGGTSQPSSSSVHAGGHTAGVHHDEEQKIYEQAQLVAQESLPAVVEPSRRAPPSLARAHRRQYASLGDAQGDEEGSEEEGGETRREDGVAILHAHEM